MDLGLTGKRVLVTGSSRGIGVAIARAFLTEGSAVVVTGRTEANLVDATNGLRETFGAERVHAVRADLAGSETEIAGCVDRAAELLGGLDVLVANVGGGSGPRGLEATGRDWEALLALNLVGTGLACRHAVRRLAAGGGSIILIASIAGIEALGAPLPYSAAKAGIIALGKSLARELAPQRIRVNTVSPGNVLHEGGSWKQRLERDAESVTRYVETEVAMRRFGTPEEVAHAVLFLASERAASFITGANVVVDGGQTRSW